MESMCCSFFEERNIIFFWSQARPPSYFHLPMLECVQQHNPLQTASFPLLWLTWQEKEKLNISFRLICGLICQLRVVIMARTIQSSFKKNFFNPISPSFKQDHMCFCWSELSDHSALMAFNSPSERLTHTHRTSLQIRSGRHFSAPSLGFTHTAEINTLRSVLETGSPGGLV